jgi:hypothetical protein
VLGGSAAAYPDVCQRIRLLTAASSARVSIGVPLPPNTNRLPVYIGGEFSLYTVSILRYTEQNNGTINIKGE